MTTEIDLRERDLAEQALWQSGQRYRRLLPSTSDYVYTVKVDRGQSLTTVHGSGCVVVTGYAAGEFAADPSLWFRMIYPEDQSAVMAQIERILRGEVPGPLEHRIRHKDGRIRWIRNTPVPHKDNQERVVAYDGVVSDVTQRKHAEQLLTVQYLATCKLAQSRTLQEALTKILEAICLTFRSLSWDLAAFWSMDAKAGVLRCGETWHSPSMRAESFEAVSKTLALKRGIDLPGRVWESGELIWIPDAIKDKTFLRAPDADRLGLHGACGFPICQGTDLVGVIEVFSREVQQPNPDMQQALMAVGTQISQFIERKHAEDALAAERNLLRTLIDILPDYIYVKDTEGRFVLNNPAHLGVLGVSQAHEVLGKTDSEFFSAELAGAYRADEKALLESGQPLLNREEPVVDSKGNSQWVLTTKVPLKDSLGQVIGLVGVTRNITERKQVEMALKESQERLALVIQGSNDGIWDWNVSTNEVYFSPRWKSMLGYAEKEIENTFSAWVGLLHPDDREHALAAIHSYFTGQKPTYELEHRLHHKDGTYRWILARGVALRNAEGKPVRMAGSHVDLTERIRAQEHLRCAYAELAQSNANLTKTMEELRASHEELKATQLRLIQTAKLESIGTLAASVAHEVKNPLQTMLMGLDYLSHNLTPDHADFTLTLNDMRDAVTRANLIVGELLQLSAATAFNQQSVELNALIERSLWLLNNELMNLQTTVVRQLGADLPRVYVDRSKMEQVFINLFMNALQAMSHRGTLTVTTRMVRVPEDAPTRLGIVSQFRPGDVVVIAEIQDTGPGIPEAHLSCIFDPFFTTKPNGLGTGLGLSIVKKIMDLQGGAIDVGNAASGGVRVTLMLKKEAEEGR